MGAYPVAGVYTVNSSSEMTPISLKIFYPVNYKIALKNMKTVGKHFLEFAKVNTASLQAYLSIYVA